MLRMLIVSSAMKTSGKASSPSSYDNGPALALLGRAMRVAPRLGAFLALAAGPLVSSWPVFAPVTQQTPEFQDEVSVRLVLVPVVIRSGAGYAKNLEKKDFRLSV